MHVRDSYAKRTRITAGHGWSAAAADDALVAIDTLPAALTRVDPEVGEVLAAVTATTPTARRRLGLPVDTDPAPGRDGAGVGPEPCPQSSAQAARSRTRVSGHPLNRTVALVPLTCQDPDQQRGERVWL